MGKASSSKKVQRAAKAGGGRARAAGERNLLFPLSLTLVVILGTLLVVYARDNRAAEALEAPFANQDHWHASYGFYICDEFVADLPEFIAPQNGGNHTHGDGLIHIHPFALSRAGENATLVNWLEDAGEVLGSGGGIDGDSLSIPGAETYTEGESTCEGVEGDPIVQVAIWDDAQTALDGDDADDTVSEGFDDIRFVEDGQAFTIAFAPEGAQLPPPETIGDLAGVGADLGVPEDEIPDEADFDGADGTSTDDTSTDDPSADDPAPTDDTPTDDTSTDDTPTDGPDATEADGEQ